MLARERFGVLATAADGRIHTATILFAETPEWELVCAIRPLTLKAQLAYASPDVAFQVDNRSVAEKDRAGFVRVSFEGVLRHIPRRHPRWQHYHDIYAKKLPAGGPILANPAIELHVLSPWLVRVAIGGRPPEDIPIALPEEVPSDASGSLAPEAANASPAPDAAPVQDAMPNTRPLTATHDPPADPS
jgi:nitroimidazol reductase NimA-like FMN-containing flavoprotein (pyridoxamine 5'-phosphate oxidase superfamily)